jgi:hypothetical protein
VDLGHEGAGGVDYTEAALFAGLADFGRNAVGAVNDALAGGDFVNGIDENGAFALELFNHETVVDDFFADVDGRAEGLEGDANDIDGADDASAESAGLEQEKVFLGRLL